MNSKFISLSLVLFLLLGAALAQSDRASITGTVKDSSGAVVSGVTVTVTNDGTNLLSSATTNSLGIYSILNLPIGQYTIKFTKSGFAVNERNGIVLQVSQRAEIDSVLKVGAASEVVMVTEDAPVLQTQSASLTTNLTNSVVTELPLNVQGGRNITAFLFSYVPGVEGDDYSSHINGSVSKSKEILIDGTSAVVQIGGYVSESQPPMEAVEEFQVSSTGLRSDEGRSGGGVFRYNLKSGTNAWHGSAFGFLHNEFLDANSYTSKYLAGIDIPQAMADNNPAQAAIFRSIYSRPKNRLSDWGGSFGGPIFKNKTFFYAAYERYQFDNNGLANAGSTVPTLAFLNGDFGALLDHNTVLGTDGVGNTVYKGAIFDPTTGNVFVNNLIPQNRISATSRKIIDIYKQQYAPITPGLIQNNAMPASQPAPMYHQNLYSVKLDHSINDKHRLAGSLIYAKMPRLLADQGGIWSPGSTNGGPLANAYNHTTNAPSIRFSDSYTFSPNVLNVFNVTFNRFHNPSNAASQSGDWSKTLGLGDFGAGNFPLVYFQGINSDQHRYVNGQAIDETYLGSQFNDFYTANTIIYGDNLSWVHGRHVTKFGAEFRAQQFNSHGDFGVPKIIFDPAQTSGPFGDTGFGFASFELGLVNHASVSVPNNTYGRRKGVSFYVQDDIKVTDRLTLNADLRWDFNGRYHEKYGHWSNFNTTAINPVTGLPGALEFAKDGSDSFEREQNYHNFSGHIGVAFQLTPKTVVRGSFGVFYVPLNMNTWGGIPYGFNPGFVPNNEVGTVFNWDNGYPGTPVDIGKDPNFTKWGMVSISPKALTLGNQQQWTIGVQRELTRDMRLDVSYVQSRSYHLQSGILQGNQPKLSDYTAMTQAGQTWNWISSPTFNGFGWASVAPFPNVAMTWGPLFYVGSPYGNADYRSLQLSMNKRGPSGLSFQVSYNFSNAHGDVDNSFQELWSAGPIQDVYNLEQERNTISPFDVKHIVKGYINYELPFGKGRAFAAGIGPVLNGFIGGWTLTSGFHYSSGTPMRITANTWYPGINNVYANFDPSCDLKLNSDAALGDSYFNGACFSNPPNGEFGNATGYLDNLRNRGLATEDLGVNKALTFGHDGRYKLSLRAQFFNVFNRHSRGGVNTTIGDANFGKVTRYTLGGSPGARQGQLGARFTF
jgi:hypothetical protein